MRAKVSLSLALASDPSLLILDEPTSGLDVLVRREFLESMVDLAGAGRTVLLSSHQIGEVERVASHVALLHKGKLILAEPLDELKARTFLLSVMFASRDHPDAPPEGRVARADRRGGRPAPGAWLVRAADRAACEALRALPGVEGLEIETPSLEEIYIGYMRAAAPRPTPAAGGARGVRIGSRQSRDHGFQAGVSRPCMTVMVEGRPAVLADLGLPGPGRGGRAVAVAALRGSRRTARCALGLLGFDLREPLCFRGRRGGVRRRARDGHAAAARHPARRSAGRLGGQGLVRGRDDAGADRGAPGHGRDEHGSVEILGSNASASA